MTVDELKIAAGNRWGEVFSYYGLDPDDHRHVRCVLGTHADRHPSFRVDALEGRFYCSCSNGDALDFVQAMERCSLTKAVDRIASILLLGPGATREEAEQRNAELVAQRQWERTVDDWHNRMCTKIGQMRKFNGPRPAVFSWEWERQEALINSFDHWVDHIHGYTETRERVENGIVCQQYVPAGGAGKGFVRGPDRFAIVRRLCQGIRDEGEPDAEIEFNDPSELGGVA